MDNAQPNCARLALDAGHHVVAAGNVELAARQADRLEQAGKSVHQDFPEAAPRPDHDRVDISHRADGTSSLLGTRAPGTGVPGGRLRAGMIQR